MCDREAPAPPPPYPLPQAKEGMEGAYRSYDQTIADLANNPTFARTEFPAACPCPAGAPRAILHHASRDFRRTARLVRPETCSVLCFPIRPELTKSAGSRADAQN